MRKGDLIPLDLMNAFGNPGHDGYADHMRVVVGYGSSSPFANDYVNGSNLVTNPSYTLLIDQHSTNRWHVPWDYNITLGDWLSFIHVIK